MSRDILMVPPISEKIFLAMKDIILPRSLIGVLQSMGMSKMM
jgi:hypothetical protein